MNDYRLKIGILELFDEGWFREHLTDKTVQELMDQPFDLPSDDSRQRFLLKLRVRLKNATGEKPFKAPR